MVIVRDITEQRRLSGALARAGHREQQRIARDLHDGLGQQLAAVALKAKVLENELKPLSGNGVAGLSAELVQLARDASVQARDIAHALAPVDIGPCGLIPMLHQLVASSAQQFGLNYSFSSASDDLRLPPETAMQLYRAVQEALTNAHRHGHAREVSLHIELMNDRLYVALEDNGSGFPDGFDRNSTDGLGMKIMSHRLASVGGGISVTSALNSPQGVRVVFEVPVARDAVSSSASQLKEAGVTS